MFQVLSRIRLILSLLTCINKEANPWKAKFINSFYEYGNEDANIPSSKKMIMDYLEITACFLSLLSLTKQCPCWIRMYKFIEKSEQRLPES